MRFKKIGLVLAGTLAMSSLGVGVSAALAVDSGTESTPTTVSVGGNSFYTLAGIEQNWSTFVADYPEALPEGVNFPSTPTKFFYAELDEGTPLFQTSLPESILSRYWRCAWIDSELDAVADGDAVTAAAASQSLQADVHMGKGQTVDSYEAIVDTAAAEQGVDPRILEFTTECGIYIEEGNVR